MRHINGMKSASALRTQSSRQRRARSIDLPLVLWFGTVNLFAAMAYEGARSITGPFLEVLGASGFVVGMVAGFGEFLGYALRFASGGWADRSRSHWPFTLAGYVAQMLAVPALALVGSWPHAAALISLERIGRAMRDSPRNVMLPPAGKRSGRGSALGAGKALGHVGAFVGPLAIAAMLAWQRSFQLAFAALAVPASVALLLVYGAYAISADADRMETKVEPTSLEPYPRVFWWCLAAASLAGFGFTDFSLIAYHLSKTHTITHPWIPMFYAVAVSARGLGALIFAWLFERVGLIVLVPVTLAVTPYAPLAFFGGFTPALIAMLLWGIGLGAHQAVMKAAVALIFPQQGLGSAYRLFGGVFGTVWFAGSVAIGALYDVSVDAAVLLAVIAQLTAVVPLVFAARTLKTKVGD
jgi:hypothetical protein